MWQNYSSLNKASDKLTIAISQVLKILSKNEKRIDYSNKYMLVTYVQDKVHKAPGVL